jgi:hypothetical protein
MTPKLSDLGVTRAERGVVDLRSPAFSFSQIATSRPAEISWAVAFSAYDVELPGCASAREVTGRLPASCLPRFTKS